MGRHGTARHNGTGHRPVGLAKAQRLAAERGVSVSSTCCDLRDDPPLPDSMVLVLVLVLVCRLFAADHLAAGTTLDG